MIIRYGAGWFLSVFLVFILSLSAVAQADLGKIRCVCIDAGHGGKDPGCVGSKSYEKNITLKVALEVGRLIKEKIPGVKVVYTRQKDVFVELGDRGKFANDQKADLFISIHVNAVKERSVRGIETYILGLHKTEANLKVAMRENSVIKYEDDYTVKYSGFDPSNAESYIIFSMMQNLYLGKSLEFAGLVQEELIKSTAKKDRSVQQAGYLVLKDVAMPAILVELGFLSNPEEEVFLNSSAGQRKMANSIVTAFIRYKTHVERNSAILSQAGSENPEETPVQKEKMNTLVPADFFYAVQIASAGTKMKEPAKLCSSFSVCEIHTGGRYRYYVGAAQSFDEVKKNLGKVRKIVKDGFIIAVHKGKLIKIAEAREIEKKLK